MAAAVKIIFHRNITTVIVGGRLKVDLFSLVSEVSEAECYKDIKVSIKNRYQ